MKTIGRVCAVVGALVFVFATSGALGVGHFRLYYGPAPVVCEVTHAEK